MHGSMNIKFPNFVRLIHIFKDHSSNIAIVDDAVLSLETRVHNYKWR